jgi:hypothetical protein
MPLLLPTLRETNRRMISWLEGLVAMQGRPIVVTPAQISGLLSDLLRASAGLRAEPIPAKGNNPELDGQLETYRHNLEQLRECLPFLHSQLLGERARLEAQRTRVQSAAEWVRASRQTLP